MSRDKKRKEDPGDIPGRIHLRDLKQTVNIITDFEEEYNEESDFFG